MTDIGILQRIVLLVGLSLIGIMALFPWLAVLRPLNRELALLLEAGDPSTYDDLEIVPCGDIVSAFVGLEDTLAAHVRASLPNDSEYYAATSYMYHSAEDLISLLDSMNADELATINTVLEANGHTIRSVSDFLRHIDNIEDRKCVLSVLSSSQIAAETGHTIRALTSVSGLLFLELFIALHDGNDIVAYNSLNEILSIAEFTGLDPFPTAQLNRKAQYDLALQGLRIALAKGIFTREQLVVLGRKIARKWQPEWYLDLLKADRVYVLEYYRAERMSLPMISRYLGLYIDGRFMLEYLIVTRNMVSIADDINCYACLTDQMITRVESVLGYEVNVELGPVLDETSWRTLLEHAVAGMISSYEIFVHYRANVVGAMLAIGAAEFSMEYGCPPESWESFFASFPELANFVDWNATECEFPFKINTKGAHIEIQLAEEVDCLIRPLEPFLVPFE